MAISLDIPAPGTIGTYDDLVAMVGNWLDRDDLTDRIPEFISLLEGRLNRRLRTVMQVTPAVWAVSSEDYALPDDFRRMQRIYPAGQPNRPFAEVSSSQLPDWANSGFAQVYAVEGRTLRFSPIPSSDNPLTVQAVYWRRIPPLGSDQPTNWLLDEHPDIYVFGTLHQASLYIRDPEAENATSNLLDRAIAELQDMSRKDAYGGPLVPQTAARQVRGGRC